MNKFILAALLLAGQLPTELPSTKFTSGQDIQPYYEGWIRNQDGSFDLVFLDAAKEQYLAYLKAVEKNLHKGSVVVADNVGVFASQMKDFLDYIRNSDSYKSRTVETGLEYAGGEDAMEISEKIR